MSSFRERLEELGNDPEGRRWLFVPYDQLTDELGPLSREDPEELGIVVVESLWKANRRPYHKQKLALVLANSRHFALEQASRGVAVRHLISDGPYRDAIRSVAKELGPLRMMEGAERELRADLAPLLADGVIECVPHEGWLTSEEQFRDSQKEGPPWRMDSFYRKVRKETGLLMENGSPAGGKYSHDAANREPWDGDPPAPEPIEYELDEIKEEICQLIEDSFGDHPGELVPGRLPGTRADAQSHWAWVKENCLEHFGPYEDAMSTRSSTIFHTQLSALINLHRLLPGRVVREVAEMDVPINSAEGFIRQVLGWREFVRHVHLATDGFRDVGSMSVERGAKPGDGGYSRWSGSDWDGSEDPDDLDGGACPSHLDSSQPLPPAFWGEPSGLACLDRVVTDVWSEGWSHHITRLMVLSNIATLLDVQPRELTDWFWIAYTDAYDWVVEPNVLGMGSFAVGDVMTTKPYVSGSAYIDRMSDYCADCRFDPAKDCPIAHLYWAFLGRHRERLDDVPRLNLPMANLSKRSEDRQRHDARVFDWVSETLGAGEELLLDDLPEAP